MSGYLYKKIVLLYELHFHFRTVKVCNLMQRHGNVQIDLNRDMLVTFCIRGNSKFLSQRNEFLGAEFCDVAVHLGLPYVLGRQ